jgi:molybdopterin molybdotransferase
MLSLAEAQTRLLSLVPKARRERVPLADAGGRILFEEVRATAPWPLFDYSAMDGYAAALATFSGDGPWTLPVRGESRAGGAPEALAPGALMRIFTGAPMPAGADLVIMQENVTRKGDDAEVAQRPRAAQHVRRKGEDLEAGAVALEAGTRLGPVQLSLLAMLDHATAAVAELPRVIIVPTGDELRAPGEAGAVGSIPESNAVALRSMAAACGAAVRVVSPARDESGGLAADLAAALEASDVVITIGGVSVGDHDLVRPTLERLGVEIDLYKVAIKPGKPLTVGVRGRGTDRPVVVLGLPGNPVSALVTFAMFGAPLLRAWQGHPTPLPSALPAELGAAVRHAPGRLELVRATLDRSGARLVATPVAAQASGALFGLAHAHALLEIPLEAGDMPVGAAVKVHLLSELLS